MLSLMTETENVNMRTAGRGVRVASQAWLIRVHGKPSLTKVGERPPGRSFPPRMIGGQASSTL